MKAVDEDKMGTGQKLYKKAKQIIPGGTQLTGTACYSSFSHTDEIVDKYLETYGSVFSKISNILERGKIIADALQGPVCHTGFQRLS